ncbi:MAG: hypothetical protein IJ033_00455 [Clostridia bacterium]|nr:hypothetical protein [Clostridia bacterium]
MRVKDFLDSLNENYTPTYIGETTLGTPIPMISKGSGESGRVLLIGATHARENITAPLLKALMDEYQGDYPVDCVPILNVDGVTLVTEGLNDIPLRVRDRMALLRVNGGSTDFSLWKANIRAVDLNVNCDANWGEGKGNLSYPSPSSYVGPCPFSEVESYAIKRLIDSTPYALVVCYHSKGEEVYYGFGSNHKYKAQAQRVANRLKYKLKRTPYSTGGIKDYFTLSTDRLGLTVEVGSDTLTHPIGLEHLDELKKRHSGIINLYAEIAKELWTKYDL